MSLKFEKYFTEKGRNVYDMFDWDKTNVKIENDDGSVNFIQKDVEFPSTWSPLARKIVASKYFFGEEGTNERENSAKDLIGRVSGTFSEWAKKQNYFSTPEEIDAFRDELSYITLDQRASFNSPVWFNVGTHRLSNQSDDRKEMYIIEEGEAKRIPKGKDREYPQTSACFIQSVDDTMEDIMELAKKEALLFKYGSGTGTNLSSLRSSKEKLSGGGKPSGPLAYWAFYDKVAGIVKSGGKTRRAAKMDILNIDHPDIMEFIHSKSKEEEKLHILKKEGISSQEAQDSVNYQNTNISIRIKDKFIEAVENNEKWQTIPVHNKELSDEMPSYPAKEMLEEISKSTWACGDPGMQYDDNINRWHTCPNSGKINASNPCSEYMFLDDSSCNLASLNLRKFLNEDGSFDTEAFSKTIRTIAIAQDLEFDNSGYPTKEIAKNSHEFRPLGMGYANLGSLVMSQGLAYDSDESRAIAASITALLTGKVYETSTEIAESLGTFKGYEKNKEPMLKVMEKHRAELQNINREKLPKGLENILDEAEKTWGNVIERGKKYGFRNAQATALAPTGTIGFMMDCDTLGIEPEIGLVQKKLLSDGGNIERVNKTVDVTLEKLGYDEDTSKKILKYIKENETVEGSPEIKEEHLAVFDTANKPKGAERTISPKGHLKMMASVQPFLSGAISKTVNLPEESSVEDIKQTYLDAGKIGLKSVALYRNNSKATQVLSFSEKKLEEKVKPFRRKLPVTAPGFRHKFDIAGHEGYIHTGLFDDGKLGEIFITMSKEGSTVGGLMDAIATLSSMSMQYGVPLEVLTNKFKHQKFEPSGLVFEGHPEIKTADSVLDYIFHYLEKEFLNGEKNNHGVQEKPSKEKLPNKNDKKQNQEDVLLGGFCPICGEQMLKEGNCKEICACGHMDMTGCGGS